MREGWKKVKFSELFNNPKKAIISGPFGSNLKSTEYQSEGVPLVRLQNVDRWKFINKNIIYITSEKAKELSSHSYKSGDILISKLGAPLGKACIAPKSSGEGIVLADIVRVRVDENSHNKDFIVYQLNSEDISAQLRSLTTGATRPRVTLKNVRELSFVIPPLPQQKQIVETLDKAFEKIDKAIANVERNIQNAEELFQSKLQEQFYLKSMENKVKLKDIVKYDKTKCVDKTKQYIGLENIEPNTGNIIGINHNKEIKSSTFSFDSRHILYGRLRPYLNKVYLPDFNGHCSTEIFPILPSSRLNRKYLFFWLISDLTVKQINSTWTGARMPRANMKEVLNFEIELPSIEHQIKIANDLSDFKNRTFKYILTNKRKKEELLELKKSILEKAFKGELTSAA